MEATAHSDEGGVGLSTSVSPLGVPWRWAVLCIAVLVIALVVGVAVGPADLSLAGIARSVFARVPFVHASSPLTVSQESILWSLRMPRVVLGALAGGTLAIAGAAYQGTFRNPLADPYLLGAAAGAELGATLAITILPGRAVVGVNLVAVAAFAGASLAVAGAYVLGRSAGGMRSVTSLILAGVAIASFLTAVQTYLQQRNADQIRQVYAWLLGRLQTAGWQGVSLVAPYVAICVVVVVAHRRVLDVLQFGDDEAASLGVHPRRVRFWVVSAGPSHPCNFHIVGEQFDTVYLGSPPANSIRGVQTFAVAPGGGMVFEVVCDVAGEFPFVNHGFGHGQKGAIGMLVVEH